jgi:hypothetical protein
MALKKIAAATEKKTEKKSSMREVHVTDKKLGETVAKAADTKASIKKLEDQVTKLETLLKPLATEVKDFGLGNMIENNDFQSVQVTYNDNALGVICMDKYSNLKDADTVIEHLTAIVGEKNLDKFVDYETSINTDALANKKVLEAVTKLAVDIKAKFDIDLLTQVLKVQKGAVEEVKKLKTGKDKKAVLDIIKPTINLTLK